MENREKKLYSKKDIREIREKHGFNLSKSLGQNFLVDKNIIDKIIDGVDVQKNDLIIEIGPGMGVLTKELASKAGKVIAIEMDKKLIPILEETLENYDNVEVINKDILKTNINEIIEKEEQYGKAKVVGNLPYYITTPIIMKFLEEKIPISSITVMMQKEVAERISSPPGGKTYGAISVAAQYYSTVENLFLVPRTVFYPPPNVDSAMVKLTIKEPEQINSKSEEIFWQCVKKTFSQRRKTIENGLVGICNLTKEEIKEVLAKVGIEGIRRPETLSIIEFKKIGKGLETYNGKS